MAYKQQKVISHGSGVWNLRSRGQHGQVLMRALFRVPDCWLMMLPWQTEESTSSLVTHKGINPIHKGPALVQFGSVQSLSCVPLFVTPWTAAHQASLSITNSQSLLKLMFIESVMPSNHLILCHPLLLLPSIFPSIRVFSNESVLCIRWPKYGSFSFNISPSKEHPGLISFRMDWLDLLAVQGIPKSLLQTTVQKHQFFGAQLSL